MRWINLQLTVREIRWRALTNKSGAEEGKHERNRLGEVAGYASLERERERKGKSKTEHPSGVETDIKYCSKLNNLNG